MSIAGRGKHILVVVIVTLLLAFSGRPGYCVDVELRWAILADSASGMNGLDFSDKPVVHSGTALQIYLEHLNNCHIYLYLLDSSNLLTPLYPEASGYYNYGFPRGPQFIPPADQTFTFVPPAGIETFFLIGSVARQFQLEKLTEEFQKNPTSVEQQKLLLSHIESIIGNVEKNSISAESREKVERRIKTETGIEVQSFDAVEADISYLYGRKLLIDHR